MKKLFLLPMLLSCSYLTSCVSKDEVANVGNFCPVYPPTPETVDATFDFYLFDENTNDFTNFYKQYVIQVEYGRYFSYTVDQDKALLLQDEIDFDFPEDIPADSLHYCAIEVEDDKDDVDDSKVPSFWLTNYIFEDTTFKVLVGTREQISAAGYTPSKNTLYELFE